MDQERATTPVTRLTIFEARAIVTLRELLESHT